MFRRCLGNLAAKEGRCGLLRRQTTRVAMAVVTRYGCWRGEFFEGCELRCGDARVACWRGLGLERQEVRRRNTANPVRYRVAIYANPKPE